MDPKASAKAKRSHTQHGRKSHPTPSAIAQKKKAAQAGSSDKVQQPNSQTLPSNWDRYNEGDEEYERSDGVTTAERETVPKSKGANFGHLIEQARLQRQRNTVPAAAAAAAAAAAKAEPLPFFDELTLDFMQGKSSTFTTRGKNLLSRCEDDNFVVDDDLTPSFEVPFLNWDLHALGAQLSKLKLSERLFIEPDILSEDLCSKDSKGISASLQSETLGEFNITQHLDSLPHSSSAKDIILQTEDQNINILPHSNLSQLHSDQVNEQGTGGAAQKSPGNLKNPSPLKVGEAEAELDLLLESFQETNLSSSILDRPLRTTPPPKISFPDSTQTNRKSNATDAGLMNKNQTIEAELDSLLDPIHGSPVNRISNLKPQNSNYQNSSIQDRVFPKNTAMDSIDDSIDVLLSEASPIPNIIQKHAIPADVSVKGLLGSGDVMDDFDSWIDTF